MIFGFTAEEVLGKHLSETIIPVQYREAHHNGMFHFLKTGEGAVLNKTIEITALHKNGHEFYVSLSISNVKTEDDWLFIAFLSDITERKKMEENFVKAEQRYRRIVETAQEGIWTIDENNITNFANKKMGQILEYSVEEMMGKTLFYFMDEEGIAIAKERLEDKIIQTKQNQDFKYITKTGKKIWANVASNAIFGEDNEYLGTIVLVTDITQRKKTEEQLKELNKELDSFTYSVSHDLRAPLRIINGYSELIRNENNDSLSEDAKRMLGNIMINAKLMGNLIDDLLNFSHMGRRALITHLTDMNSIVHQIMEVQLKNSTSSKYNITINDLPKCVCDSSLVKQVWENLISNAIKYSANCLNPQIEIGAYNKNDDPVYYIKDNGVGFDMNYYDKLFGVFQRLHNDSEFAGSGVGLALTQRIILKQGGKIWAESIVNTGTTFYFNICL